MIVWIALDSYDSLDSCASFVLSLEQEAPFFKKQSNAKKTLFRTLATSRYVFATPREDITSWAELGLSPG